MIIPMRKRRARPEHRRTLTDMVPGPKLNEDASLAVFFLLPRARVARIEQELASVIEATGFELLKTIDLDETLMMRAAAQASDVGSELVSEPAIGDPPARLLIAVDVLPWRDHSGFRKRPADSDNGRIGEAVLRCRQFVEHRMPQEHRFEPVMATKSTLEAWELVRRYSPGDEQELQATVMDRMSAMETHFEVVRDLTRAGARSKIELIRYGDGLAVKKTFRHNCHRFMEREADFMETFSAQRPEIPPVLERGHNYIVMPFVEGQPLRRSFLSWGFPRLMTLQQTRTMADLLRFLFSRGYDPVDLGPHNLLIGKTGRITAIDFEYVHRAEGPVDPEQSACLGGLREGFKGEWTGKARAAPQRAKAMDPWRQRWIGSTGLSLRSFLHDPPWLQQSKRLVIYPVYLVTQAITRGAKRVRSRG